MDELDDGLARLNKLELTWGFELGAIWGDRTQQAPCTGDTVDGRAELTGLSQGSAVGASSVRVGRPKEPRQLGRLRGAWCTPPRPSREGRSRPERAISLRHQAKGTMRTHPRSCRGGKRTS